MVGWERMKHVDISNSLLMQLITAIAEVSITETWRYLTFAEIDLIKWLLEIDAK